jgi:hypothetical protein
MLSPVLLHDDLSELSQQQLDDALVELCAHMNAAEYRLLEFVGEYDSRGLEGALGVRSLAHWLNYRCGIDLGAAREKVRVARALRELPAVREAFAAGTVSYSKVRAITRVATPANEDLLLGYAKAATASQLEQIVRGYRRMERLNDPDTVLRQQRERGLRWWIDEDGSFVIEGRFPPEDGALILRALEAVQARTYREEGPDATADTECPAAARRGDALVRLVEAGPRTRTGPCRAASGRSWWCTCRRPPGNPRTSIRPRRPRRLRLPRPAGRTCPNSKGAPSSTPRPPAASPATPAWSPMWRTGTTPHSPSAAAPAPSRRGCIVRCGVAMAAAVSRAARTPGMWMPTTCTTGRMAVKRPSTT